MNTALIDLPALLRSAMEKLGCDPSMVNDVHQHSPIAMQFNNAPDIYLASDESDVWLYTRIRLANPSIVNVRADDLLRVTLLPRSWARAGFLTAGVQDDDLHLNVALDEACLADHEQFAVVLEEFYDEVRNLNSVLA